MFDFSGGIWLDAGEASPNGARHEQALSGEIAMESLAAFAEQAAESPRCSTDMGDVTQKVVASYPLPTKQPPQMEATPHTIPVLEKLPDLDPHTHTPHVHTMVDGQPGTLSGIPIQTSPASPPTPPAYRFASATASKRAADPHPGVWLF
eukprot:scaffold266_cov248-Pinguiococcus_pyrenoidosus.AAC.21